MRPGGKSKSKSARLTTIRPAAKGQSRHRDANNPSVALIRRNLDQIAVWIAAIHRLDRAQSASPLDWPLRDRHATIVQMSDYLIRRHGGDEAQITRAGLVGLPGRPGINVVVMRAEIDLLAAKFQRGAIFGAENLALHTEDTLIPRSSDVHVGDVKDDVVDAVDGKSHRRLAPVGWVGGL